MVRYLFLSNRISMHYKTNSKQQSYILLWREILFPHVNMFLCYIQCTEKQVCGYRKTHNKKEENDRTFKGELMHTLLRWPIKREKLLVATPANQFLNKGTNFNYFFYLFTFNSIMCLF